MKTILTVALLLAIIAILVEAFMLVQVKRELVWSKVEIRNHEAETRSFGHTLASKQIAIDRATFLLCGPTQKDPKHSSGLPVLQFGCITTAGQIAFMWGYNEAIEEWHTNRTANTTSEGIRQSADGSSKPSM